MDRPQTPPGMVAPPLRTPRTCSQCGNNGHNARTCTEPCAAAATSTTTVSAPSSTTAGGFMLFGVMIKPPPPPEGSPPPPCISPPVSSPYMRKVVSMNNMSQYEQQPQDLSANNHHDVTANGYASDDAIHASDSRSRERKRGIPWTEEEHKKFLLGLKKVGKGDWRGISRNYVKTRTPTQVASHAQKYFLRHVNVNRRRRRSSLFDITTEAVISNSPSIEDPSFNQDSIIPGQTMPEFMNPSMVPLPATSSKQIRNIPLIPLPPTSKMANLNLNQSPSSSSTSTHSSGEQHQPEQQLLSLKLSPTTPTSDEESMSRASAFRGFKGNGDSIISVA